MKPPSVTINVAGSVLNISALSAKQSFSPKPNPILKHALINPARRATIIPLVKLKSFTAFFFSSSLRLADFMLPARPIMPIPTNVTTTPTITDVVKSPALPVNTGVNIVPNPAQVPKAIDCPRATPK